MRKAKQTILIILTILLIQFQLFAQSDSHTHAKNIESKNLKRHVYVLASDSCAGRAINTEGITIARNYIAEQWDNNEGLHQYTKDGFLQAFHLLLTRPKEIAIEVNSEQLELMEDFMYYGPYDDFNQQLPIVFAGYGSDEDLEKLQLKNKAVLILTNNLRAGHQQARKANEKGAALCILANPKHPEQFNSISRQFESMHKFQKYKLTNDTANLQILSGYTADYRYITISPATVKQISSKSITYWEKQADKHNMATEIGSIQLIVKELKKDTVMAHNIISSIPGINQDEIIVVGAHYDHLGQYGKDIYRGADDNASGTAALIELANVFAKAYEQGFRPQKSILFAAFSAEEGGIHGSQYFINQFASPDQIKLMLNIDMIGRCDQKHSDNCNYFYFIKNSLHDSIVALNDSLCKQYHLNPDYTSSVNFSDHRPFMKEGIPTIFYFDGKHEDLHKTTDIPSKIDFQKMTRITRLTFETIWITAQVAHTNR